MANKTSDIYIDFDKKLLDLIATGRNCAAALSADLEAESTRFVNRPGDEFRVVDRRLQALRKKGLIAWERRGRQIVWRLT